MEFLVATNNEKKLAEIRRIMETEGHTIVSLEQAGISIRPRETGKTFAENARIKAAAACQASGMPSLGDDSGLEVDALGGDPGVLSARFAGSNADDARNNEKLLGLLERTPYAKRTARFVCVVALEMPDGANIQVEGRCDGIIGFAPTGHNGFGYDPLFYIDGRSFAEMTDDEKDAISHRATALRRLAQELPAFLGQQQPSAPEQPPQPQPQPQENQ